MKFNKKWWFILIIVVIAGFVIYNFARPKGEAYKTEKVKRGSITQEIAETGTVKKGEAINLSFKNSGNISAINIGVGQAVVTGQILAELDTRQLNLQLEQARANLELYQAQLEKLVNGASIEDKTISQTGVQNAKDALDSAQKGLNDAQDNANQKLANLYDAVGDVLTSAYAKAYNAQSFVSLIQRTYFAPRDEDSIFVWQTSQKMEYSVGQIKIYLDAANFSAKNSDFDKAISVTQEQLTAIESGLHGIRAICEKTTWRDTVSTSDKTSLDTHRDYIIAAQNSVNTAKQNIDLQKTTNEAAINTAKAAVIAAQGALKTSQEQLAKISAAARQEDVAALNSQIESAAAQVGLLELQISDSQLKAPINGQVVKINSRAGETISALTGAAVVILPDIPYYVEVDIYEEDVVKERINDPVKIEMVSEPDKIYNGRVMSIDPSGKLINGVVYYTTKIAFDQLPADLKPEMTADVVIVTAQKDNVLLIPENTLQKKDTQYFVQILKDKKPVGVNIVLGIKSKGQAEIISGLTEGQEVIIP